MCHHLLVQLDNPAVAFGTGAPSAFGVADNVPGEPSFAAAVAAASLAFADFASFAGSFPIAGFASFAGSSSSPFASGVPSHPGAPFHHAVINI